MKRFSIAVSSASLLLLAACVPTTQAPQEDSSSSSSMMMEHSSDAMMKSEGAMMSEDSMMSEHMMEDEGMMHSDAMQGDSMMKKDASVQYTAFTDSVIGNGEQSVLFFHAGWCPYCKSHDASLQNWYNGGADLNVSTYKIDYDTADALKTRFGVVQQDTFVLIDGEGNVLKLVSFPTESALKSLLSA